MIHGQSKPFHEGMEMVAPVPDPDYQSEVFQMGITSGLKPQGEAPALW